LNNEQIEPGIYTVFLRGNLKANYARNPQAIQAAEQRRKAFDGVLEQLDSQMAVAEESLTESKQTLERLAAQVPALEQLEQSVAEVVEASAQHIDQTTDRLAQIRKDASAATAEESLSVMLEDIQQAAVDAQKKMQQAKNGMQRIRDRLDETRNQLDQARTRVTKTEHEHQQVVAKRQRAGAYSKQLDEQLAAANKNFGPTEVSSFVYSPAITLEILKSPVTVQVPSTPLILRRGETREIDVRVERRFQFADAVRVSVESPADIKGVGARRRRIERHQDQVTLQVSANNEATLGEHTVNVKLEFRFNGLRLEDFAPLQVTVRE
jgi:DNA repair exonuclease SbcCD ATPase subunit